MLIDLLATAVIIATPQTPGTNWVVAGGTADNEMIILIDTGTMRRDSSGVSTAWVMAVNRQRNEHGYDYVMLRKQYRCEQGDWRMIYAASYQMQGESPLVAGPVETPWEPALPSSTAENEMDTVCADEAIRGIAGPSHEVAQLGRNVLRNR